MQAEGPNKSEELLQRYAKQRREQGGDFSLHPATRRLLQGEVTRELRGRAKEERGWLTWFGLWRGRFAAGAAVAAVLFTGVWIFWNGQNKGPMQVADARMPAKEGWLEARSANDGIQPEPVKQIATAPVPVQRKLAARQKLVELQSERDDGFDRRAKRERPADVKLGVAEPVPRPNPVSRRESRSYFADFGFIIARTNGIADYTPSLTPVPNTWALPTGSTSGLMASLYSYAVTDFYALGNQSPSPPGDTMAAASALALGSSISNSVSLADNAALYYQAPAPLPLLTAKDGRDGVRRRSELSDLSKAKPEQLALTRGGTEANRASLGRGDISIPSAPSAADNPVLAGVLATDKAKEKKPTTVALDRNGASAIATTGLPGLAPDGSTMKFSRLRTPAVENEVVLAESVTDEFKKDFGRAQSQVLARFTVEQRGRAVRVVDSDGSLYDGDMDTPLAGELGVTFEAAQAAAGAKAGVVREQAAGFAEANASRAQESSFRASGSNVTLRQFVVVNGTFTQGANAASAVAGGANGVVNAPVPSPQSALRRGVASGGSFATMAGVNTNSPVAIEGTVRIGATNLQWFKAVREPR